jgi:DNA modification methylase
MTELAKLQREQGTVVACDCLDTVYGLPSLGARSVDVILTDPPYGKKVHEASRRGLTNYKEKKGPDARAARVRHLGFNHLSLATLYGAAAQFARLARRWVLVFSDQEGVDEWKRALEDAGLEYVRTGIWVKIGCAPQMTGDRPAAGHECIVIAHQQSDRSKPIKKHWNGGGHHAVWRHAEEPAIWECPIALDRGANGARVHTAQKPIELMRELVSLFSNEGEVVCDPFTGSGTTGVACRMTERRFFGYELDPAWAAVAERRLAGQRALPDPAQPELF